LRRVTTTLSALAASGGFAPDAEGALLEDRDPPGFEVLGAVPGGAVWSPPAPSAPPLEKKDAGVNPFLGMAKAANEPAPETVVPTVSEDDDLERAAREAEEVAQKAAALAAAAKERLAEANARKQREEVLRAAKAEVERLREALREAEARVVALEEEG
jgi:hypothetical protein